MSVKYGNSDCDFVLKKEVINLAHDCVFTNLNTVTRRLRSLKRRVFMKKSVTIIPEVSDCDFLSTSHNDCDLNPKKEIFHRDQQIDFYYI